MTTWSLPDAVLRHRWSPTAIFVGANARERARIGLLLAVGVVGLAFRFWLANNSIGCQDADIWKEHAALIATRGGVGFAYEHPELEYMQFNHPPLMGYLSVLARRASGSEMVRFSFLMKLPGLLTEVMTAGLIWSIWSKRNARAAAGGLRGVWDQPDADHGPWPKLAVLFGVLAWAVLAGYLVTFSRRLVAGRA